MPSEQTIQAIETSYAGHRCRSRLEARWLRFLDAIGIEYWYEPEGYKLQSGVWYLPDLYLPRIRYYAEIKPITFTTPEVLKCDDLAHDSGRPVLMLDGPPGFKLYDLVSYQAGEQIMTNCLLDIDYHGRKFYDEQRRLFCDPAPTQFNKESDFTREYRDAVYAARGERFEGVQ